MADQVTNSQLSSKIGDLQGAVGRIEGLLVGISADLLAGRHKFEDHDKRIRAVETKLAVYAAGATIVGAGLSIAAKFLIEKIFA